MAIIAPFVCRYTISGTAADGVTWANIWDVDVLTAVGEDRGPILETYARLIIDVWGYSIAASLTEDVNLTRVSWVDLNSADGTVGSVTTGLTTDPPYNGGTSGAPSPAAISAVATKTGSSRRGARNGRMSILGIPEADASSTAIAAGPLNVLNQRLEIFFTDLQDNDVIAPVSAQAVVVHTRNAGTPQNPDIVYNGKSNVTGLVARARLGTQTRRMSRGT